MKINLANFVAEYQAKLIKYHFLNLSGHKAIEILRSPEASKAVELLRFFEKPSTAFLRATLLENCTHIFRQSCLFPTSAFSNVIFVWRIVEVLS